MTDPVSQLDTLLEILVRMGVDVRKERLAGSGGGLCTIRGRHVVFVDQDIDVATQLDHTLTALASLPDADTVYLIPELRERLDRLEAADRGQS